MVFKTQWRKTFWLSVQFFSQLPTPNYAQVSSREMAAAMAWSPFVGLVLGALLALNVYVASGLITYLPAGVLAIWVLGVWVGFSKGLHLDGVADVGDAWMGAFGDAQRALNIMKDSRLGTGGVIALGTVLLLKWQLIVALFASYKGDQWWWIVLSLVFIPAFARLFAWRLMHKAAYVGRSGHHRQLFRYWRAAVLQPGNRKVWWLVAGSLTGIFAILLMVVIPLEHNLEQSLKQILGFIAALALFLFMGLMVLQWGFNRLIAGVNGDTVGATIEALEILGLVVLVGFLGNIS